MSNEAHEVDVEKMQTFCSITDCEPGVAQHFLEACDGNVENAITLFYSSRGDEESVEEVAAMSPENVDRNELSSSPRAALPGSSNVTGDFEVRAPIPQSAGILVDDPQFNLYGGARKRKVTGSVFETFRDFEAESRATQEALTGTSSQAGLSMASTKRKTLEDLFKPPLDLTYKGTFEMAKEKASTDKKWLLVNVQDVQEFACQTLNRDIFNNPAIRDLIENNFILWQLKKKPNEDQYLHKSAGQPPDSYNDVEGYYTVQQRYCWGKGDFLVQENSNVQIYHDSSDGQRFQTYYNVNHYPHVAILDPRTGERLSVLNTYDAHAFSEAITNFLEQHPSFEVLDKKLTFGFHDASCSGASRSSHMNGSADKAAANNRRKAIKTRHDSPPAEFMCDSDGSSIISDDDHNMPSVEEFLDHDWTPPETSTSVSNAESHSSDSVVSRSWQEFIGSEGEDMRLMIRFPNGEKEQLVLKSSSYINAILLFVANRGFSLATHEVILNYPRRCLSDIDPMLKLSEAKLASQETIFVQEK